MCVCVCENGMSLGMNLLTSLTCYRNVCLLKDSFPPPAVKIVLLLNMKVKWLLCFSLVMDCLFDFIDSSNMSETWGT